MEAERQRPRILIVAGQLVLGGAERELVTFLEGGATRHADIHVISLAQGGAFRPRIEEILGRRVLSPPWPGRLRRTLWMRKVLTELSPDLIHSWNLFPIFYLWMVGASRRCPVVGFLQQTPDQAMAESAHPWLYRFLVRQTDALVSNSNAALEETNKLGIRVTPSVVVQNAVSARFFQAEPSEGALAKKGDRTVMVALGRLIERKRIDWMIRAVARVPKATLWLIGDGPERPTLIELTKGLGVADRVVFWGALNDPAPVLAAADVFVHCAWAEGLPNAVQEAMATGLPVLAPRVSGIPEIIRDGKEGFLFEREDFEEFVALLERLVSYSELRLTVGRQAREKAQKDFVPVAMTEKMFAFYEDILGVTCGKAGVR